MTPKEYAQIIKGSKAYKGGAIRLISCQAGRKEDGAAQQLANELNVPILAATETVNVDYKGRIFITDNVVLAEMWNAAPEERKDKFVQTGEWKLFEPKKEEE